MVDVVDDDEPPVGVDGGGNPVIISGFDATPVQLSVAPVTFDEIKIVSGAVPEQISWAVGEQVRFTDGWTVTVKVFAVPKQLLAIGVTSYVTIPSEIPVLFKMSLMIVPQLELQSIIGSTVPEMGS